MLAFIQVPQHGLSILSWSRIYNNIKIGKAYKNTQSQIFNILNSHCVQKQPLYHHMDADSIRVSSSLQQLTLNNSNQNRRELNYQTTFPPEAHRDPSGDTVTVFRYPVWPMWLVFSLQFARFHTYIKHKPKSNSQ